MKDETQAHLQDKHRIKLLNLTYMYMYVVNSIIHYVIFMYSYYYSTILSTVSQDPFQSAREQKGKIRSKFEN